MENWRFIEGTDCRYMVSDAGRVASFKRGGSLFSQNKELFYGVCVGGDLHEGYYNSTLGSSVAAKAFSLIPRICRW
ncbi:MAG: NUMOD4 domain-containing protein [Bacteroides graminisolvens]